MEIKTVVQSPLILLLIVVAYCEAGTVSCQHPGRVYQCPEDNCAQVSTVHNGRDYPCDCYVIGQPSSDPFSKSPKWYRLNLPTGKHGYVNSFFCGGDVPRC